MALGMLASCSAQETQKARAQDTPPPVAGERGYELQLGLYFTATWSLEDPFINIAKSMRDEWGAAKSGGVVLDAMQMREGGFLSQDTGAPIRMPDGAQELGAGVFLAGLRPYPNYYAGKYTFEWDGKAYGYLQHQPRDLQTRIGENRLRFYVSRDSVPARIVRFSQLRDDGVTGIRIYRDENRKRLLAGEIWNPEFLDYVKRYDILRTMDMQATNESPVRSFADVARPEDIFYGNRFRVEWPPALRYGAPFEVLFNLGVASGAKLWLNIPAMVGAPMHPARLSLRDAENPNSVDIYKLKMMARDHARAIVASEEWDIFAKEFVDRLVASGYPADRPLYLELSNEIWNTAPGFAIQTYYAWGIGLAFNERWDMREGYGILSARWASALETELAARGLDYDIIYVLAGQTAWPARTTKAIKGYKYQLKKAGANLDAILARTGVALTTYSHCAGPFGETAFGDIDGEALRAEWERSIDEDPEGLKKRLRDNCVNAPAWVKGSLAWVVKNWRDHERIAKKEGVRLIGAYEGGSHDSPPTPLRESEKFRAWWKEYHWGPYGADVVRQVNLAIIDAFPGVILSNYASIGAVGDPNAPWIDGHYAEETAMLRMWDEFAKPQ